MLIGLSAPASAATLTAVLEGLTALNAVLLQRRPKFPLLYESGVVYKREQRGSRGQPEDWANILQVLKRGWGDCEDLAAWRAAELRVRCEEPAQAVVRRSGPRKFHAVVVREDGFIEDPSKVLGMKGKS